MNYQNYHPRWLLAIQLGKHIGKFLAPTLDTLVQSSQKNCGQTPQPYFSACSKVRCISWCKISRNVEALTFFVPGSAMSSVR